MKTCEGQIPCLNWMTRFVPLFCSTSDAPIRVVQYPYGQSQVKVPQLCVMWGLLRWDLLHVASRYCNPPILYLWTQWALTLSLEVWPTFIFRIHTFYVSFVRSFYGILHMRSFFVFSVSHAHFINPWRHDVFYPVCITTVWFQVISFCIVAIFLSAHFDTRSENL